jgi:Domain of unknown function (DUF1902)
LVFAEVAFRQYGNRNDRLILTNLPIAVKVPAMNSILVKAEWDTEAEVWTATSADVPGLVAEANSIEILRPKVLAMIGDLAEEGVIAFEMAEIPVHIVATVSESIRKPVAA